MLVVHTNKLGLLPVSWSCSLEIQCNLVSAEPPVKAEICSVHKQQNRIFHQLKTQLKSATFTTQMLLEAPQDSRDEESNKNKDATPDLDEFQQNSC